MTSRWRAIGMAAALGAAAASPLSAQNVDVGGFVGLNTLVFTEDGQGPEQIDRLTGELQMSAPLSDTLSFDLRLYGSANLDADGGGSYVDPSVAKLSWQSGDWQVDLGYDTVFWGVAESRNVVNVINQRDQIRDFLGDLALGQPMLAARYFGPSFTVEGYVLLGFRELDFGADDRRWGFGLPVDDENSLFEDPEGAEHIDYALRLSGVAGDLEYGIFAFDGTRRAPDFVFDPATRSLIPKYVQVTQYGVDLQYTRGATLFKFEGVHVDPDSDDAYQAAVYGIEHVFATTFGQPWESTIYLEHNWDSRGEDGPSVFQNDLFTGLRVNFGNTRDTQIRLGASFDLDGGGVFGSVQFDTRLTQDLNLSADYIFADADDPDDALYTARDIDHLSVGLEWYF